MDPQKNAAASSPFRVVSAVALRCWPLLLGNAVEWYEWSAYGYMSPQMRENFFGGSSVATWLCFALTFIARPLGGTVLGHLGDNMGRKVSLNLSIFGMMIATVSQGLLPTRRDSGEVLGNVGLALLIFLRFLQGLSAGGEIGTIVAYMAEVSPLRDLGLVTCLVGLTAHVAALSANALVAALVWGLDPEQMLAWGWRLPFLFAALPASVAVWGRRRFPESEKFLEEIAAQRAAAQDQVSESSESGENCVPQAPSGCAAVSAVLASHGKEMLIAMASMAGPSVLGYVGGTWLMAHLEKMGADPTYVLMGSVCAKLLGIVLVPLGGFMSDIFGIGFCTFWSAVGTIACGAPVYALLAMNYQDNTILLLLMTFGFLIPHTFSMPFLFCVELFPTAVRSLCMGISWNVSVCIFGGFGGFIAQTSLELSPYGPGIFMSLSGLISAVAVLWGLRLQRQGRAQLTHLRAAPYWGRAECKAVASGMRRANTTTSDISNEDSTFGPSSSSESSGKVEASKAPSVLADAASAEVLDCLVYGRRDVGKQGEV